VITDFRPPDLVRFGLTPLYTGFTDIWDVVERLGEALAATAAVPQGMPVS
jgi:kynureninase